MNEIKKQKQQCPYCGEMISILVDCSIPHQNYIEDCQVCCQPITFDVTIDIEGIPNVIASNENEQLLFN